MINSKRNNHANCILYLFYFYHYAYFSAWFFRLNYIYALPMGVPVGAHKALLNNRLDFGLCYVPRMALIAITLFWWQKETESSRLFCGLVTRRVQNVQTHSVKIAIEATNFRQQKTPFFRRGFCKIRNTMQAIQ